MAHKIEKFDKQQGLKQAWHGLTEVLPEITLENNWLTSWDVVPVELLEIGEQVEINGATYFTGEKSGLSRLVCSDIHAVKVGQGYNPNTFKPIDNKAFLGLVRDSIGGTPHKICSVGSLRNRGRVFLSVELAGMERFKSAGREFSAFLNFGNGHDKSSVLWVSTSNVCTVCDNTYTMNLVQVENKEAKDNSDDIKMNLRHTKNANLRLPDMAKLIDKAVGVQAEFAIELEKLAEQTITEKNAENLFAGFVGRNIAEIDKGMSTRARNTVSRLKELHIAGLGNNGENLADSFQAVTEYYTRESSGGDNKMRQVVSSEFGAGQASKAAFWQIVRNGELRDKTIERGESLLAHTN